MRNYNSVLTFGILILLLLSSCGSSNGDCEEAALEQSFSSATDRITSALINVNPTDPNSCQEFKDAFDEYIDELESLQDCANDAGQGTEWRESIKEARESIGQIGC